MNCPRCNRIKDLRSDYCPLCANNLMPGAARADGSAFASTDWLGEVEAALSDSRKLAIAAMRSGDAKAYNHHIADVKALLKLRHKPRPSPNAEICERRGKERGS